MQLNFFLIVTEGGQISVRKTWPRTRLGEIVIPMRLQVPDTVFRPRIPQPIAIEVPEAHIAQPVVETLPAPEEVDHGR
jgi:hypothetical protein